MPHFRRVFLLAAPVVLIVGKLLSDGAETTPQAGVAAAMKRAAMFFDFTRGLSIPADGVRQ